MSTLPCLKRFLLKTYGPTKTDILIHLSPGKAKPLGDVIKAIATTHRLEPDSISTFRLSQKAKSLVREKLATEPNKGQFRSNEIGSIRSFEAICDALAIRRSAGIELQLYEHRF
ncbi:hypothetical protein HY990_02730 [Candidatus Micrarchaeota archaeon]|nr:hypothetical protein [Candidatus Micrarchaeota archaeon]